MKKGDLVSLTLGENKGTFNHRFIEIAEECNWIFEFIKETDTSWILKSSVSMDEIGAQKYHINIKPLFDYEPLPEDLFKI